MKESSMPVSPAPKALRSQSGAFDLPSILIGVVVVGLLAAGVLAAIFGVIPYSQDKGALQDLSAINTAEGVAKTQKGAFTDKAGLTAAGLTGPLPAGVTVNAEGAGAGYCATSKSGTGRTFAIAAEQTTPWQGDCTFTMNWAKKTPSTIGGWGNVAMSGDGRHLLAIPAGVTPYLFTSADAGTTWTQYDMRVVGGVSKTWRSVAVSADGTTMMAGQIGGNLFTSTDSGATWVNQPMNRGHHWYQSALSADGKRMIAGGSAGLWTSHDAGSTWTQQPITGGGWQAVAITPDGRTMIAGQGNSSPSPSVLYTSTDSGVTWTAGPLGKWSTASVSADGNTMAAGQNNMPGSSFYTSKDRGVTWQKAPIGSSYYWGSAISADGKTIMTAGALGYVEISRDQGATWNSQASLGNRSWNGGASTVAVSADGKSMAAMMSGAYFTSTDGGASWTDQGAALNGGTGWTGMAVSGNGKSFVASNSGGDLWMGKAGRRVTG